jgi:hypothetical protein
MKPLCILLIDRRGFQMMIIKIEATETGLHHYETQSHRMECWIDGYIVVPEQFESAVIDCNGYCDLVIKNNILENVVPRPDLIPTQDTEPTEAERLRADIDYIAIMTGVEL